MKKRLKQIIAFLLVVVMLGGSIPTEALAAGMDSSVLNTDMQNSSDYRVMGTNSVGTMLADEMQKYEELQTEQYNVIDIEVEEKTATVSYNTLEECIVVVAIYDESGKKMLASGKTTAMADANEVAVTIETATMPEYFIVSAYLIDVETMQPLCESYTSENYTKEFQEFLAKTTDDFPQDRVLNLDESKETNFAVYGDDTIIIEKKAGVNIVETADFENEEYTITNVNESISNLKTGDVFAYQYDDSNVMIVEIGSIQINGTTATIIGTDTSMEDAFSYVKIETRAQEEDFIVDNSNLEEGIVPVEDGVEPQMVRPMSNDEGYSKREEKELTYNFSNKVFESLSGKENVTLNGNVVAKIGVEVKFYLDWDYQYMELVFDYKVAAHIDLSGNMDERAIELGSVWINPLAGVYITVTPKILVSASAKIEVDVSWSGEIGFSCSNTEGLKSKNKNPNPAPDRTLNMEGKIFAGIAIEPSISIVCKKVAEASLEGMAGIELYGSLKYTSEEQIDESHECVSCLDGDINAKARIKVYAKFLNSDKLTFKKTWLDKTWKLVDFYYSFDKNKAGFGECPYVVYRLKLTVKGSQSRPLYGVQITIENQDGSWETDENGECTIYLPKGTYKINCKRYDDKAMSTVTISGEAKEIEIPLLETSSGGSTGDTESDSDDAGTEGDIAIGDGEDSGSEDESGTVITSGTCGENLQWSLDNGGTLRIWGSGEMENYDAWYNKSPWYNLKINKVIIEEGMDIVGTYAFWDCSSLEKIELPEGITAIGSNAFSDCGNLQSIKLPEEITEIRYETFRNCSSLKEIELPEGITLIDDWAFYGCTKLEKIKLSEGITSIGFGAFEGCSSLKEIELPEGITSIEAYVFAGCSSLKKIELPERITLIRTGAFEGCSSLEGLELPEGIILIEQYAFKGCSSLEEMELPEGITSIEACVFKGCSSLKRIELPEKIASIGEEAFYGCSNLEKVELPEGITSIEEYAFWDCISLEKIELPEGIMYFPMNAYYVFPQSTVIYGYSGSLAEKYAEMYGNPFVPLETTVTSLSLKEEQAYRDESIQLYSYSVSSIKGERTASFSNLTPNTEYVFVAVKSKSATDILASDNLLYIGQKKSDSLGKISFTYIPREEYAGATEMILGLSEILVESVIINQSSTSLEVKNQLQLVATVLPQDATNSNITWSSSNPSIATVDNTGLVTAVGTGQVTITATAQDGSGAQASIIINVTSANIDNSEGNGNGTGSTGGGNTPTGGGSSSGGNGSSSSGNSSGTNNSDNQNSDNSSSEDLSAEVLYYVVNFDTNGGIKLSRKKMTLLRDDNLGILPTVQRENYKFLGWYTEKTGGVKVKKSTVLNASTTLYAHWKKVTKPAKVEIVSLKPSENGKVTIKFEKLPSVGGYQIMYSTNEEFASSKTKKVLLSSTSKTIGKLKEGTTYYFKVRAYKEDSTGKKIYGKYSKVKTVVVKEA